jgi:hypothetical protein
LLTISFFSATRIFSMVVVSFQAFKRARFSTLPLAWLTEGMLTLLLKEMVGPLMGYSGPQTMCRL